MSHYDDRIFRYHTRSLFVLLFIGFAGAIIGDSTAEALLLSHCPVTMVPRMFLVNAAALFLVSAFIISLIDRVDRGKLFCGIAFSHAFLLIAVRAAISGGATWLYIPLFTYAYITKLLLFLLFWTLANDLVDSRRAQSAFPRIAAGGTIGAILIAFSIPAMVKVFSAENLLFVWSGCACMLGIAGLRLRKRAGRMFLPSSDRERRNAGSIKSTIGDFATIARDPLLANMAVIYGTVFFILITQHYFFYTQIKSYFVSAERIAGFLGYFNGASMAATVVLQVAVSGWVIKKIGSSRSMLFLPGMFLVVFGLLSALCMSLPAGAPLLFYAIIAGMGVRLAFFDSFFSPNFQVFFSSLPMEIRGRAKLTLEGVIKPVAISLAGLWLIAGASRLPLSVSMFVCTVLAGILFYATLCLKTRYTQSLTRFLTLCTMAGGGPRVISQGRANADFLTLTRDLFARGDFEIQRFLIDELIGSATPEFTALALEAARHPDPRVRATIAAALGRRTGYSDQGLLISYLSDTDNRVVANAILALSRYRDRKIVPALTPFLASPVGRCKANAAITLWRHEAFTNRGIILPTLSAMLDSSRPDECGAALYAIGEIEAPETFLSLKAFAELAGRRTIRETPNIFKQFVQATGKKTDVTAIDLLLEHAKEASRIQRLEIIGALGTMLRRGLSFDVLTEHVRTGDPLERNILVRAVHESMVRWPASSTALLTAFVMEEIEEVDHDTAALKRLERCLDLSGVEILWNAVREESVGLRLETAVFALSILDTGNSVRKIIPRLFHADRHVRARALEVLDNAAFGPAESSFKRMVMRLLDASPERAEKHGPRTGITPDIVTQTVVGYLSNVNSWIRRCAAYAIEEVRRPSYVVPA